MVDASEFVDGAYLDVRLLAGTIAGAWAIAIWSQFRWLIVNTWSVVTGMLTAPLETAEVLIRVVFAAMSTPFDTAISTAENFIRMLQPLGPFAFLFTVVLTVAMLWVGAWAIQNVEVI